MRIIISENRVNQVIRKYLDDVYYPDYGWYENDRAGTYQDDVDKFGDVFFYIDDVEAYVYYGCNANSKNHKYFDSHGHLGNYKCPLLLIFPSVSERLRELFGDKWKPIFKEWFESNTGLKVEQITDDYI